MDEALSSLVLPRAAAWAGSSPGHSQLQSSCEPVSPGASSCLFQKPLQISAVFPGAGALVKKSSTVAFGAEIGSELLRWSTDGFV